MPPTAASPERNAAPELVVGSVNANSLNNANGATHDTRIRITPGSAVPIAAWVVPVVPVATPLVICTPTPSIAIINGGVNAAAWNQRKLFQNQAWPGSANSPAAAIGVIAANTISAPARVIITNRCPTAADHTNNPS